MKAINGVTVKNLLGSKKSLVNKVEEIIGADANFVKKYVALEILDKKEYISRSSKAEAKYIDFLESIDAEILLEITGLKDIFVNNSIEIKKAYVSYQGGGFGDKARFFIIKNELFLKGAYSSISLKRVARNKVIENILNTKLYNFCKNLKTREEQCRKTKNFLENYLNNAFGEKKSYHAELYAMFNNTSIYSIKDKYSLQEVKKIIFNSKKNKQVRKRALINSLIVSKLDCYSYTIDSFLGQDAKENLKKVKENLILSKKFNVPLDTIFNFNTVEEVQKLNSGMCIYAGYVATVSCSRFADWNYYSKNYIFPKTTIGNRKITFKKVGVNKTIYLENFKGNFMLNAYIKAFKIKKYKQKGFAKKVQLNDAFRAKKIRTLGNVELWKRTLDGEIYDYCAVLNKTTYHAFSKKEAVTGLRKKINAKIEKDNEKINKELGLKLGFCRAGMMQFCADNNLNFDESYTRADLRNIVIQKRELNYSKYREELKKIGIFISA